MQNHKLIAPTPITKTWVSAGRTRNYMIQDPILDWFKTHGEKAGFTKDNQDPRTDFATFIMQKGHDFEEALYKILDEKIDITYLKRDFKTPIEKQAQNTIDLMAQKPQAIAQACVACERTKTYGFPDLLVRSDVLERLFPEDAASEAPIHYVVVDIKFTSLNILKGGTLGKSGSSEAYKAQLYVYNRALGAMQGYESPKAYLMGRGYKQGSVRGQSALDRLGVALMHDVPKKGPTLEEQTNEAIDWVRRVQQEGANWNPLTSDMLELRPNMSNTCDGPWHGAKKDIAQKTGELTQLWHVGVKNRNAAIEMGVRKIDDVKDASSVLVTGAKRAPIFDALLNVQKQNAFIVREAANTDSEWIETPKLEFYVDFETVSDLNDDFTQLPNKGGQSLIYMIGCGHIENGQWTFKEFTVNTLCEKGEADALCEWFTHMAKVTQRLDEGATPKVIHWSNAEVSFLESAYNSARARHQNLTFPKIEWFDFLKQVIKAEPIVVKGALGFGLKAIAKAMHKNGLIQTSWGASVTDGLGAMVAAWFVDGEDADFKSHPLIREVADYNEVDTKVMWEIVHYLRKEFGSRSHEVAA